jgi:hypothetical protein
VGQVKTREHASTYTSVGEWVGVGGCGGGQRNVCRWRSARTHCMPHSWIRSYGRAQDARHRVALGSSDANGSSACHHRLDHKLKWKAFECAQQPRNQSAATAAATCITAAAAVNVASIITSIIIRVRCYLCFGCETSESFSHNRVLSCYCQFLKHCRRKRNHGVSGTFAIALGSGQDHVTRVTHRGIKHFCVQNNDVRVACRSACHTSLCGATHVTVCVGGVTPRHQRATCSTRSTGRHCAHVRYSSSTRHLQCKLCVVRSMSKRWIYHGAACQVAHAIGQ